MSARRLHNLVERKAKTLAMLREDPCSFIEGEDHGAAGAFDVRAMPNFDVFEGC